MCILLEIFIAWNLQDQVLFQLESVPLVVRVVMRSIRLLVIERIVMLLSAFRFYFGIASLLPVDIREYLLLFFYIDGSVAAYFCRSICTN